MKKLKTILTDCDGVILDWEEGFSVWMEHHGHEKVEGYQYLYNIGQRYGMPSDAGNKLVKQFNESAAIGFLPPLRDAQFFVKKLHEQHQYKFVCITSLSLDPYAEKLRRRNLQKLMGDAFLDVLCFQKDQSFPRQLNSFLVLELPHSIEPMEQLKYLLHLNSCDEILKLNYFFQIHCQIHLCLDQYQIQI